MRRRAIYALLLFSAVGDAVAAGCGSRGGPGYRGPNGKCVGWAQLHKVCGQPPTLNCTYEGPDSAGSSALLAPATPLVSQTPLTPNVPGPIVSNRQTTRITGTACVTQEAIWAVRNCALGQGRRCEADVRAHLDAGSCSVISAGTVVKIEAGSHSFDWLRISVPGVSRSLWIERRLVLDR